MSGPELYAAICSGCHGINGDGRGPARQYLWPLPRSFRDGRFRLVSTRNHVPTTDDIESVIENGMPGTSMTSYKELTERQRRLLAEEVLRLRRDGVRQQVLDEFEREGIPSADEATEAAVQLRTAPGEIVPIPVIKSADSYAIARGKQIYRKQSCHSCHGDDGVGVWDVHLRDNEGWETRPRDLVHEHFKGGRHPESIYLRLHLGMPGTPHPSSPNLSQTELIDLVQFCRSLSREPKLNLRGYERRARANSQSYLRALGNAGSLAAKDASDNSDIDPVASSTLQRATE